MFQIFHKVADAPTLEITVARPSTPSHFPSLSPPLPDLPLKSSYEARTGSAVSFPSGPGRSPAAIDFRCILTVKLCILLTGIMTRFYGRPMQ